MLPPGTHASTSYQCVQLVYLNFFVRCVYLSLSTVALGARLGVGLPVVFAIAGLGLWLFLRRRGSLSSYVAEARSGFTSGLGGQGPILNSAMDCSIIR